MNVKRKLMVCFFIFCIFIVSSFFTLLMSKVYVHSYLSTIITEASIRDADSDFCEGVVGDGIYLIQDTLESDIFEFTYTVIWTSILHMTGVFDHKLRDEFNKMYFDSCKDKEAGVLDGGNLVDEIDSN